MSTTANTLSPQDLFERAESSEKGVRVRVETLRAAHAIRFRLYKFREQQRKKNAKIYPADHNLWNKTVWDDFSVTIEFPYLTISRSRIACEVEDIV